MCMNPFLVYCQIILQQQHWVTVEHNFAHKELHSIWDVDSPFYFCDFCRDARFCQWERCTVCPKECTQTYFIPISRVQTEKHPQGTQPYILYSKFRPPYMKTFSEEERIRQVVFEDGSFEVLGL